MTNTPYVKQYNEDGTLIPLKQSYLNDFPNRRQRKSEVKKKRFFGNGKNRPLTVLPTGKFLRFRQAEKDKNGNVKFIEHYIPC
jgi:hypothetical protein